MGAVRVSVKAIIVREERLLVLKCRDEESEWYMLPGGGQEAGETMEQALRRECLEELGCAVRMGPLRFVRDYIAKNHEFADSAPSPDFHQVELMFECHLDSEPTGAVQPDSMQDGFAWLDVTRLPGSRLYPRILERVLWPVGTSGVTYLGDVN
jgi:ADP-ribose pyrophosphatase YjhB (NUDIX family)